MVPWPLEPLLIQTTVGDVLALIEGAAVLSRQQDLSTQFPNGPQFAEDAFQWPPCLPVTTLPHF